MGANAVPPQPALPVPPQPALPVPPLAPSSTPTEAELHFTNLLAYFKHLVWLTSGCVTVIVAVTGFFLFSNLRDVRQDAKEQASRVATTEAETAVKNAFDEKNINALILKAAKDKVGTVTDKMIEEQLSTKLRPVEDRILLIGRISECEARIHMGYRASLVELTDIENTTHDPVALGFAKSTLVTTSEGYDTFWETDRKRYPGGKPLEYLTMVLMAQTAGARSLATNLHDVVAVIYTDQNLNSVAVGFIVFREITGENVKMFDFGGVKSWCSKHQTECQ